MNYSMDVDETGRIHPEGRDFDYIRTNVLRGSVIEAALRGQELLLALESSNDETRHWIESELLGTVAHVDLATKTERGVAWLRLSEFEKAEKSPDEYAIARCAVYMNEGRPSGQEGEDIVWQDISEPFRVKRGEDTIVNIFELITKAEEAGDSDKKHKWPKGLVAVLGAGAVVGVLGFEIARRRRRNK